MATTTVDLPAESPTIDEAVFAHRWLARVQAEHEDLPEDVLRCYFEHDAEPSVEDIREALGCDEAQAKGWQRVLNVRLVSPGYYGESFAAADALTQAQQTAQRYQEDCRETARRLQELQAQIEAALAYRHTLSDAADQAEVQTKLEVLDAERVTLLRHEGDLPGAGRRIETQLTEATAALAEAEATLTAVRVEQLRATEDAWLQELLAALEPVRQLVAQGQWLDQAWAKLGVSTAGHEHGKERLRDVALSRLRRG